MTELLKTLPPELATLVREALFLLIVVAAAALALRLVGRGVRWLASRLQASTLSLRPLTIMGRSLALLVVVSVVAEHYFAVDFFAMLGGLLALIGVGFIAVWSTLSNALCSLLLISIRPFSVGDELELVPDPIRGRVTDLGLFFTTLEAPDGRLLQLPNSLFFQRVVLRRPAQGGGVSLGEHFARKTEARPTGAPLARVPAARS